MQVTRVYSWVWKILWRRKWQPTAVFLPGESLGERNLTGESPYGPKELNTTKVQLLREAIQRAMDAETKKIKKQPCSY